MLPILLEGLKALAWYILSPDMFRCEVTETRTVQLELKTERFGMAYRLLLSVRNLSKIFPRAQQSRRSRRTHSDQGKQESRIPGGQGFEDGGLAVGRNGSILRRQ